MSRLTIPQAQGGRGPARTMPGQPRRTRVAITAAALVVVSAGSPSWSADAAAPSAEIATSTDAPAAMLAAPAPCFRVQPEWRTPEEILLGAPVTALGAFGILVDVTLEDRLGSAARSGVRRFLGFDEVALNRGEIRLRKEYGERLTVRSTTGLGASAEDALQADYRLWDAWYLRSEARERGETFMELHRVFRFW